MPRMSSQPATTTAAANASRFAGPTHATSGATTRPPSMFATQFPAPIRPNTRLPCLTSKSRIARGHTTRFASVTKIWNQTGRRNVAAPARGDLRPAHNARLPRARNARLTVSSRSKATRAPSLR